MTNRQIKTLNQKLDDAQRGAATAQALASVRAEGLEPSASTQQRMKRYVRGEITVDQLQSQTLAEVMHPRRAKVN